MSVLETWILVDLIVILVPPWPVTSRASQLGQGKQQACQHQTNLFSSLFSLDLPPLRWLASGKYKVVFFWGCHLKWLRCSLGEFACTASCVTLGQTSGLCTDEGNILQFGLFMNLTAKNNRIFHSRANCFALKDYGFQTKFPLAGAPSRGQSAWDHFHIRLFLQLLCSRELKL